MSTYTIEQISFDEFFNNYKDIQEYLYEVAPSLSKMFGNKLDYRHTDYASLFKRYIFLVCLRDGKISGHMICNLFTSPLDSTVRILSQVSFHTKPGSGRSAYHLFHKFLDIGKARANHVITHTNPNTNIKSSTLERMGFEEVETVYRLEITDECRR